MYTYVHVADILPSLCTCEREHSFKECVLYIECVLFIESVLLEHSFKLDFSQRGQR